MALLVFNTRQRNGKRSQIIPHDKAISIQDALDHPERLTKGQRAYLDNVHRVYLAVEGKRNSGLQG